MTIGPHDQVHGRNAAPGRIIVSGVGKSGIVGRKIAATLTSTGTPATFLHPVEALHGDLGLPHREVVQQHQLDVRTHEVAAVSQSLADDGARAVVEFRAPSAKGLVLAPTRELALQVSEAFERYAAHLPGVLASLTAKPVIGIPLDGGALGGADALYAVVQMPPGVPVATVAIGSAGAKNAGHLAARILALADEHVAGKVAAFRDDQASRAELRVDPRA